MMMTPSAMQNEGIQTLPEASRNGCWVSRLRGSAPYYIKGCLFLYKGPELFNSLSTDIKNATCISAFTSKLKAFLFYFRLSFNPP